MNTMTLQLLDGVSELRLEGITSLVAEDATGQFGLRPGHEPLVTVLVAGLIRCRLADGSPHFLACTGGLLRCRDNMLQIVSARFLSAERDDQLTQQLDALLHREQGERTAERQSRAEMERALMKRLREWSEASHT